MDGSALAIYPKNAAFRPQEGEKALITDNQLVQCRIGFSFKDVLVRNTSGRTYENKRKAPH
jgi:hypothetical protein